jgi:peptide/nickel transport system substrate-binding protein
MMNNKPVFLLSGVSLILALLISACVSVPPAAPQAAPATEKAEAAAVAEETTAAAENIAVYAHPATFPDLDPSPGFSNENVVMGNVYETLTFYNPPGSPEALSPKLAVSWESSDDATEWTFKLREGVKFHDGTDFKADAVKFSIERTKQIGLGAAFIHDPIEEIEVVDDLTVKFKLGYAAPLDLILSSGYGAWIMSPATVADKNNDWFNAGHEAGTGPYTIESYEPGQRMVLSRFDDYWGGWVEGQFDKVVFEIVEDPTVAEQMIRSGEADFTYNLPFENYAALAEAEGVTVDITPSFQNLLGLLNSRKPPLDDPKVRQALVYSFPYEAVVENLYAGMGTRASGPVPAGMWGHDSNLASQYTFDLDKAAALLAEAGYPEGGLDLVYTHVAGDLDEQQIGELWRAELSKIGVNLEVRGLAWEAQWDLAKTNPEEAQDIFAFYWWPTYITPYDFLFSMYHSEDEPFFNLGYYNNPDFDSHIDKANELSGVDRAQAEQMFVEAQQMLIDDAASLFIVDLPHIHVIRDDITGFVNNPAYSHIVFWYDLKRGG